MTTTKARKLTLMKRVFYKLPKEIILFIYFKLLRNRTHLRYLLFDKLYNDVGYVIKNIEKDHVPAEEFALHTKAFASQNQYYATGADKEFIGNRVNEKFMTRLVQQIKLMEPDAVVDVGCGSGNCLNELAPLFPAVQFYGLDFELSKVIWVNKYKNIHYVSGYPLNTINNVEGSNKLVFSTQALLHALPKELDRYFTAFEKCGVSSIAINDTNINGYRQRNDGKLWSKHMGYSTGWCHNYSGYMKKHGYEVSYFNQYVADFHPSRADYEVVSIFGHSG